jgi:hypothetical protein
MRYARYSLVTVLFFLLVSCESTEQVTNPVGASDAQHVISAAPGKDMREVTYDDGLGIPENMQWVNIQVLVNGVPYEGMPVTVQSGQKNDPENWKTEINGLTIANGVFYGTIPIEHDFYRIKFYNEGTYSDVICLYVPTDGFEEIEFTGVDKVNGLEVFTSRYDKVNITRGSQTRPADPPTEDDFDEPDPTKNKKNLLR